MGVAWEPPAQWQERPVCIVGGGVLGRRIAACFVAAGFQTRIVDPSDKSRAQALSYIRDNLSSFTTLTKGDSGTVQGISDLQEGVENCWLVIEAIPEILELKEELFVTLEKAAPPDAILASNSSSYKSRDILGQVSDDTKARVLNTHFMMPPEAIIVELMTSGSTHSEIFPFLVERLKAAGLHPIVALKESDGFIFNRLWASIKREVLSILAEGVATPETIDSMWIEQYVGQKMGPCRMMDAIGLDTVQHIEEHCIKTRHLPTIHLDYLKNEFIDKGKLGLKSDQGGLFPAPKAGSLTRIFLLNIGLGEPLAGKNMDQVMHSGQVLSLIAEAPSRPVELVGKLYNPDGIDIASSTQRMYWTTMGNPAKNDGAIQSANLDGSDVQFVLEPGRLHTGKQLMIDQEANKLYFCDREGLRVMRCDLDGGNLETLYQTGDWEHEPDKIKDQTLWPVGITVSKKLGKFFWTQKGGSKANQGRIFQANLDMPSGETAATRSDVEVLIGDLPECIDLEFDDEELVLYWTDRGELPLGNTLNKKHLNQPAPTAEKALGRQIIAQGLGEGIGLRLDKSRGVLYVADMSGHLWECSTEPGMKKKITEGATHAYTGVALLKV